LSLRVLNVLHDGRFGGPQSRVVQVAGELAKYGVETILVLPFEGREWANDLPTGICRVIHLNLVRIQASTHPHAQLRWLFGFWSNVLQLRKLILKENINVVHANGLINLQAPLAARLNDTRLVWHLNDTQAPLVLRSLLTPFVRWWSNPIAVSAKAVAKFYGLEKGLTSGRLLVLYPPVDVLRFKVDLHIRDKMRQSLQCSPDARIIGTIANIHPSKGIHHLIRAASRLYMKWPNIQFIIVGKILENRKDYYKSLEAQVINLGLGKVFRFLGKRNDIPALLAAIDIYVHPSLSEACPMAVMEASAAGKPVVATRVGGTDEVIMDGETGLLVMPADPEGLANAVDHLLTFPETANILGQRGRDFQAENFTVEIACRRHILAYFGESFAESTDSCFPKV